MNERHADLITRLLDGSIAPTESDELLAAVRADEAVAQALSEAWEIHQQLRGAHGAVPDESKAVQRILYYIRAKTEADQFVEKVEAYIESATGRNLKEASAKPNIKVFGAAQPAWRRLLWPAAAAAGIAAALALYWSMTVQPTQVVQNQQPADRDKTAKTPTENRTANVLQTAATLELAGADVKLLRGSTSLPAQQGAAVLQGERIQTPPSARATLRAMDGSTIELDVNSELGFDESSVKRTNLKKGSIFVSAVHQPDDDPLVFRTASADAVVVGTKFELSAEETRTVLRVAEGTVRFDSPLGRVRVEAGNASSAVAGRAPDEPAPVNEDLIAQWRGKPKHERNLFLNGAFANGDQGWTISADDGAVSSTFAAKVGHSGDSALKIDFARRGAKTLFQDITVKPDTAYDISMWVKMADSNAIVEINWIGMQDKKLREEPVGRSAGTQGGWKQIAKSVKSPDGARIAHLLILFRSEADKPGSVLLSDCQWSEGAAP